MDASGCCTTPPGPSQTIVITPAAAPAERKAAIGARVRVIEAGQDTVDLGAALQALAALGHASILTEGGPRCSASSPPRACSMSSA